MFLAGFAFKPALVPSIATVLILPGLLALGFWQLDRARQKTALLDAFHMTASQPPASVTEVRLADPAARYRKVTATGRYLGERQILLDNQIAEGKPGYHVYTPFELTTGGGAILVNRGWIPLGESRQRIPDIAVPATSTSITGRLSQPANPGLRLGSAEMSPDQGPMVLQYIDYEDLAAMLGYPLAPAVLLLSPEQPHGYRRNWRPHFASMGPEKHRGYAVQWFALAAALGIIYIAANLRRQRRTKPS